MIFAFTLIFSIFVYVLCLASCICKFCQNY